MTIMKTQEFQLLTNENLEGLPIPVIKTNLKGEITFLNVAAVNLYETTFEESLNVNISKFLFSTKASTKIESIILNLKNKEISKENFQLKKSNGAIVEVTASFSRIENIKNELIGSIITIKTDSATENMLRKLDLINNTLSKFGSNYHNNINKIIALCGELIGASSALYNRLDNNLLYTLGKWNTPENLELINKPDGHICYDVIRKAKNDTFIVRNLPDTPYANTDPMVLKYGLKTYVGQMIRCNGEPVGSLCLVFQHDYEVTKADQYFIRLLALALEAQEIAESSRKSEYRFQELFDFAVEGILISSQQGIITNSNNSLHLMTGFTNEELVGQHISNVLFTKDSLNKKPLRMDLLKLNKIVVKEREILCKNNNIISVEMHSKMMPDGSFQTVLFNITERNNIETKLRISENTYRGIINSLNDAVYIINGDGLFVDVNHAAELLYGYEKADFLNKSPEFLSAPGLNNLVEVTQLILDSYNGKSIRFEFWGLRKDGSIFPKEVSLSPGTWFDQKIVVAVGREITERKEAEKLLKISEEKYRLLVQYSSDPIFSFNIDETYRFVNDAFAVQFGKKPDEIIGKTPFEVFPAEEAEKRLRLVRHVFSTGEKGEIEVKVDNVFGEEKYYLTIADPIKDQEGKILWVTCISKEITQRKKAEEELKLKNEELKASNAEKDKFFSIVAHDLRGPMSGFLGLTGIMADEIENLSGEELKEIALTMRTSAVNISRLIENLLEWSKMQRGIIRYEPQPLFLKPLLLRSIELMKDIAAKKEIELKIDIPENVVVTADIHMLETVFRNLLSNAIKFTHKKGLIETTYSKSTNNMAQIEVKDSGIGMSADLISKLFLLTENSNRKGTEGETSTGLGLILCKEFIEKQGGTIKVESEENKGSSIIFTLPEPN